VARPGSFFEKEGKKVFNHRGGHFSARKDCGPIPEGLSLAPLEKNDAGIPSASSISRAKGGSDCASAMTSGSGDRPHPGLDGSGGHPSPTATTTSDRPGAGPEPGPGHLQPGLFPERERVGAGGVGKSIFVGPGGRVLQVAGERETS